MKTPNTRLNCPQKGQVGAVSRTCFKVVPWVREMETFLGKHLTATLHTVSIHLQRRQFPRESLIFFSLMFFLIPCPNPQPLLPALTLTSRFQGFCFIETVPSIWTPRGRCAPALSPWPDQLLTCWLCFSGGRRWGCCP